MPKNRSEVESLKKLLKLVFDFAEVVAKDSALPSFLSHALSLSNINKYSLPCSISYSGSIFD